MKTENKILIAHEIVLNFKLIIYSCILAILITIIYGVCIYPPKTHYTPPTNYTPPTKSLLWGELYNDEWPESEDGDAVFVPSNVINIGTYWSAYFSNETKYDEIAYMQCVSSTRSYQYSKNPKVSDVIEAINKTRMQWYKKDLLDCFALSISGFIILLVCGRYLVKFIAKSVKWIIKYNR